MTDSPIDTNVENKKKKYERDKQYREKYKVKIAEYNEKNKVKIAEYKKQYHQNNKEKAKEKGKEIVSCECGCNITRAKMSRHKKSMKHDFLMNPLF